MTLQTCLAYLTRALKTKTEDAPSRVTRVVRRLYHPLIILEKEFPGCLEEISRETDLLPKGWDAERYAKAIRALIAQCLQRLRKERQSQRYPQPTPSLFAEQDSDVVHRAAPIRSVVQSLRG